MKNLPATRQELETIARPPGQQSDDLIKRIAMDIGKQVVEHIEHAYPQMFEAVSDNAKLSVRNATYNAIISAGEAFSRRRSEQRISENERHRRTMRRLRKAADEAGTKPVEETLQEIRDAVK